MKKIHAFISWMLLAYFGFIIVPPVSSFALFREPAAGPGAVFDKRQSPDRARLLLFDIILWQNMKKTKHCQEVVSSPFGGADAGWSGAQVDYTRVHSGLEFAQPAVIDRYLPPDRQSRSSAIRFSRSGTSPPSFS